MAIFESLTRFFSEITTTTSDINKRGQDYFNQTYGETASTVQPFLKEINPDLGTWRCIPFLVC